MRIVRSDYCNTVCRGCSIACGCVTCTEGGSTLAGIAGDAGAAAVVEPAVRQPEAGKAVGLVRESAVTIGTPAGVEETRDGSVHRMAVAPARAGDALGLLDGSRTGTRSANGVAGDCLSRVR